MDKEFADWLRVVDLEHQHDVLTRRWQGLEAAAESPEPETATHLAALFYGLPGSPEFRENFESAFKNADSAFPLKDNNLEVSALAGATLAHLIKEYSGDSVGRAAILAVVVPSVQNNNPKSSIPDIIELGWKFLEHESAQIRQSSLGRTKRSQVQSVKQDLEELKQQADNNTFGAEAFTHLDSILAKLAAADRQASQNIRALESHFEAFREESDILWWLTGGVSVDGETLYEEISAKCAGFLVGHDLGRLVRRFPGPLGYEGLIERAIRGRVNTEDTNATVASFIADLGKERLSELARSTSENPALSLCPLFRLVSGASKGGKQSEWSACLKDVFGIPLGKKHSLQFVAKQAYLETLLLRQFDSDLRQGE